MGKFIGYLFAALFVWLILTQPTTAANFVNHILMILETAFTNITHFFSQVVS